MHILIIALLILVSVIFGKSFKISPYAYRNIIIMSIMIFLCAVFVGCMHHGLPESDILVFLWEFTRDLAIPICCICLFVCVSNVFLLIHEGFRRNNFLGLLVTAAYLILTNALWIPLSSVPAVVTPFIVFARLMLCYAECTVLAVCVMGYAVLKIKPDPDKDFVIILGCSISKKGKLRPLIKGRVNRAIRFTWEQEWKTGKSSRYIPSGGQGADEPMSEGSAMELYLLSHGAEDDEVIVEKRSKNTYENIAFSKKIIDDINEDAKVAVVTTNYHVLRSGMIALRSGLHAQLIGSETKWYFWPNAFFREMCAILFMNLKVHAAVAVIFMLIVSLVQYIAA